MKFFARFLLLLCLVLLGKSGHVHLHANLNSNVLIISATESGSELVWRRLKATEVDEDEDEEYHVAKKYPVPVKYCNNISLSNTHRSYSSHTNGNAPFSNHLYYSSQHRYIMYHVIRV